MFGLYGWDYVLRHVWSTVIPFNALGPVRESNGQSIFDPLAGARRGQRISPHCSMIGKMQHFMHDCQACRAVPGRSSARSACASPRKPHSAATSRFINAQWRASHEPCSSFSISQPRVLTPQRLLLSWPCQLVPSCQASVVSSTSKTKMLQSKRHRWYYLFRSYRYTKHSVLRRSKCLGK